MEKSELAQMAATIFAGLLANPEIRAYTALCDEDAVRRVVRTAEMIVSKVEHSTWNGGET
jgi:hypothetical protein